MEAEAADGIGSASGVEGLTGAAKGTAKGSGNGLGGGAPGPVGRGAAVGGVGLEAEGMGGAAPGVAGGLLAGVGKSDDDGTTEGLLEPGDCGVERVGKGVKVGGGSVTGESTKGCCNDEAGLLTANAGAGLMATPVQ